MKNLFFLLFILLAKSSFAEHTTYKKLIEVNHCWTEQKDITVQNFEGITAFSEKEWIQVHLALVEQTLRARRANHLNSSQQINRSRCLDILHLYGQEANFPINEDYAFRTPIFIDKYDNFCAVGFLVKETGNEAISRKIAAQTNLAYVREMNYTELGKWADDNGFTVDELAWIQPSYPPKSKTQKVGNGVDGFVQELFVDTATQQLFVGGKFIQADKSFVANNIAYVTENAGVYTWHKMGNGVKGQVNAIAKFDGKIFVAGSFDSASGMEAKNIAYWDGSTWNSAGCIDGVVNDLTVFEGVLYAAGNFKSCGADLGKNFAKWNGTEWTTIAGIEGGINTMEGFKDFLVLGGQFDYDTSSNVNAIKWNPTSNFHKYENKVVNEVMDFEVYGDTLHAACRRTIKSDTLKLLFKLTGDTWTNFFDSKPSYYNFFASHDTLSFNTLCQESSSLNLGGFFTSISGMTVGQNTMAFGTYWLNVDSTVNKMVLYKDEMIVGGKFKTGRSYNYTGGEVVELNGITMRKQWTTSIINNNSPTTSLKIYPNPAQSGQIIHIDNSYFATEYSISTVDGKQCNKGKLVNKNEIQLPQLAAGIYFIELHNASGKRMATLLQIE